MSDYLVNGSVINNNTRSNAAGNVSNNAPHNTSKVQRYMGSLDYPPDTVTFSGKQTDEKKGLSTGAKIAIGTGVVTAITVAADFIFCEGKHVKNLLSKLKRNKIKPKTEPKVDTKVEQEIKAITEPKVEPKVTTKAEPQVNANAETKVKTNPESEVKAIEGPKTKPEPEIKPEVNPTAEAKVEPKTEQPGKIVNAEAAAKNAAEAEVRMREWGKNYADKNMDQFDKLFLDSQGNFTAVNPDTGELINFKDLVRPYNKDLGTLYHGTTPENKAKILAEGFRQDVPIAHGDLDGIGGTYFGFTPGSGYGTATIAAKFNGKVAEVDTETIEYIFKNAMYQKTGSFPNWKPNSSLEEKLKIRNSVVSRYMQNKIAEMGYQGIVSKGYSAAAGCQYFSALDPKCIQIIS